jgi:hypothetical protein
MARGLLFQNTQLQGKLAGAEILERGRGAARADPRLWKSHNMIGRSIDGRRPVLIATHYKTA